MSGLWERWHELSRRGGLDVAGCQMLGDWKKEADGLRRELETANQAMEKLQGQLREVEDREAALREALEKILNLINTGIECSEILGGVECGPYLGNAVNPEEEAIKKAEKLLSTPSPSQYREVLAVVNAAKYFPLELIEEIVDWYKIEAQEEPAGKHTNETLSGIYDAITVMTDALTALNKAGEGAGK